MKQNKRKQAPFAVSLKLFLLLTEEKIKVALYTILVLAFTVYLYGYSEDTWLDYLDVFVIILAFAIDSITKVLSTWGTNSVEDSLKLQLAYGPLVKRYTLDKHNMWLHKNNETARSHFHSLHSEGKPEEECRIPVVFVASLQGKALEVYDQPQKQYELPPRLAEQYDYLLDGHSTSTIYNSLNVRLDQVIDSENTVALHCSRTTYFDSLASNRVMDLPWENRKLSVRNLFCVGPYVPPLEESQLSNHLGFNGFVMTTDQYIPFILRNSMVSIGKNTISPSIAASLKCIYCLDKQHKFSEQGLRNAIEFEIKDELGINFNLKQGETPVPLNTEILAVYRDLLEGGKPQFFFFSQLPISKEQVHKAFHDKLQSLRKDNITDVDGDELIFIHKDKLQDIYLGDNQLILHHPEKNQLTEYKITGSAAATLEMLLLYLEKSVVF